MSQWRRFNRALSSVFCCVPHVEDGDHEPNSLNTLQPASASALSIALPSSSIPHSLGSHSNDVEVLRQIFSSSSSVRGYQAAASPKEEMLPWKNPARTGHRPHQKSPGSALHSRLDEHSLLLGTSHRSTGLSDLLRSRNASGVGYDSDAKSIETAMFRSNAGTIHMNPGFAKQVLKATEIENGEQKPTTQEDLMSSQLQLESAVRHGRSQSLPATPSKLANAVPVAQQHSSYQRLPKKILGATLGNVTHALKQPEDLEVKSPRGLSMSEKIGDCRRSFSTPPRVSSLSTTRCNLKTSLRSFNEKQAKMNRESLTSSNGEQNHTSLVSNLDPILLEYINRFGEKKSEELGYQNIAHTESSKSQNSLWSMQPEIDKRQITSSSKSSKEIASRSTSEISATQDRDQKRQTLSSIESDKASIHLYNMRISQQLASVSHLHGLSPSHSKLGSNDSQSLRPEISIEEHTSLSNSRFPSWIAHEHNRKPSDPQTRRLFEGEKEDAKSQPLWKSATSFNTSLNSFKSRANEQVAIKDDASSFYASDEGPPSSMLSSSIIIHEKSIKHPNSLAIGGRLLSAGSTISYASKMRLPSVADGACIQRKSSDRRSFSSNSQVTDERVSLRNRSVTNPNDSKFNEITLSPTPMAKAGLIPTDDHESLSAVGVGRSRDERDEAFSEFSVGAANNARNERFSEIDPGLLQAVNEGERSLWKGIRWGSRAADSRQSGDFSATDRNDPGFVISKSQPKEASKLQESATNMWERALKKAREGEGRELDHDISLSGNSKRFRGDDGCLMLDLDQHQRLCSIAKASLTRSHSAVLESDRRLGQISTVKEGKIRKRSVIDFKRFATLSGPPQRETSSASTPVRELFSSWTRFPSHTRKQRCGAASELDGVLVRDFPVANADGNSRDSARKLQRFSYRNDSIPSARSLTPGSWRRLTLRKQNGKRRSKSMLFGEIKVPSNTGAKIRARSPFSFKRLYRSHSSDLRNYIGTYGHRSSISFGGTLEYPELEMLPGEGLRLR